VSSLELVVALPVELGIFARGELKIGGGCSTAQKRRHGNAHQKCLSHVINLPSQSQPRFASVQMQIPKRFDNSLISLSAEKSQVLSQKPLNHDRISRRSNGWSRIWSDFS
jgi:hypothetical protein